MKEENVLKLMLKILRIAKNKNINEIEKELGLGENVYGNYERGTRLPDVHTLKKIANYFDVSVDFIIGVTDSPDINFVPKQEYTMDIEEAGVTFIELLKNKKIKDLTKQEMKEFIRVTKLLKNRK